jgi:DNA topoisomerase IA
MTTNKKKKKKKKSPYSLMHLIKNSKKKERLKSREIKEVRQKKTVGLQTYGRPWSETHGWVSPTVGLLKC